MSLRLARRERIDMPQEESRATNGCITDSGHVYRQAGSMTLD